MRAYPPVLGLSSAKADTADRDKQFLAMAAQSDVNEIKLSQLAETKASAPNVKSFAHKMVADHKKLEMKMKPYAMAWGLTPPTDLDAHHKDEYAKLNGLSGADFDKEYMSAMAKTTVRPWTRSAKRQTRQITPSSRRL